MPISAVKAALGTVQNLDPDDDMTLAVEEEQLSEKLGTLLPAERQAYTGFATRLREVQQDRARLATYKETGGLPMLPLSVLSWTKRQTMPFRVMGVRPRTKVPVFAYLPILSQEVRMGASWNSPNPPNGVPDEVYHEYIQALRPLADATWWAGYPNRVSLRYQYPGAVPKDIKELIENETRFEMEEIAFVCEVGEWQVEESEGRFGRELLDPIVVGFKGGCMWVLGSFDPTPVETYLLNEFVR